MALSLSKTKHVVFKTITAKKKQNNCNKNIPHDNTRYYQKHFHF